MNFGSPAFVVTIVALCMAAWVITTYIRAKHGYPLTDDWGNPVHPVKPDDEATKALSAENSGSGQRSTGWKTVSKSSNGSPRIRPNACRERSKNCAET